MDERLVSAGRSAARRRLALLPALAVVAVVAATTGWLRWLEAILYAAFAAVAFVGLVRTLHRPRPVLRLSPHGLEGAFGLIGWADVTGVRVRRRLGIWARGVVIGLNPEGRLHDATRTFAPHDAIEGRRDRLIVSTGPLDIGAEELVRAVERYRAAAWRPDETAPAWSRGGE